MRLYSQAKLSGVLSDKSDYATGQIYHRHTNTTSNNNNDDDNNNNNNNNNYECA